jgi:hypothetical protein
MGRKRGYRYVVASILVGAGIVLPASAARAANAAFTMIFPPDVACSFQLVVSGTGGNTAVRHATDEVLISGGTGSALTFFNPANGKSVSFPSNGTASVAALNPDKSISMFQDTGHNVLILFPTDFPAGPSTTLIVGRVVVSIDMSGNFHVLSISGQRTDICALLS